MTLAEWREAVQIRDKHTCLWCHLRRDIVSHHIKDTINYPELRLVVNNGASLCSPCHEFFHKAEKYFGALGLTDLIARPKLILTRMKRLLKTDQSRGAGYLVVLIDRFQKYK